jgi:hypothetical protein
MLTTLSKTGMIRLKYVDLTHEIVPFYREVFAGLDSEETPTLTQAYVLWLVCSLVRRDAVRQLGALPFTEFHRVVLKYLVCSKQSCQRVCPSEIALPLLMDLERDIKLVTIGSHWHGLAPCR